MLRTRDGRDFGPKFASLPVAAASSADRTLAIDGRGGQSMGRTGGARLGTRAPMVPRYRMWGHAGFTLIELMVVVMVVGVLLAIALPTFLGVRSHVQDAVAKS